MWHLVASHLLIFLRVNWRQCMYFYTPRVFVHFAFTKVDRPNSCLSNYWCCSRGAGFAGPVATPVRKRVVQAMQQIHDKWSLSITGVCKLESSSVGVLWRSVRARVVSAQPSCCVVCERCSRSVIVLSPLRCRQQQRLLLLLLLLLAQEPRTSGPAVMSKSQIKSLTEIREMDLNHLAKSQIPVFFRS